VNQSVYRYILAYLLWFITMALAVLAMIIARETYRSLLAFNFSQRFIARAVDNFAVLLLAILAMAVVILTEHYYRTGVSLNRLGERFCLVTALELGLLALMHGVQFGLVLAYARFDPLTLAIVLGELVGTLGFWWLYRRLKLNHQAPKIL